MPSNTDARADRIDDRDARPRERRVVGAVVVFGAGARVSGARANGTSRDDVVGVGRGLGVGVGVRARGRRARGDGGLGACGDAIERRVRRVRDARGAMGGARERGAAFASARERGWLSTARA